MDFKIKPVKKSRIAVAISGGIDSAFAAYTLKNQGFYIFGITIKTYDHSNYKKQLESVRKISEKLKIKYFVLDLTDFFEKSIIEPFCQKYIEGITPNPCVECNKIIKFGILWEKAKELGADCIATGHYAILSSQPDGDCLEIKKGLDKIKDQSYFLWKLDQEQLKKIILPLGSRTKKEVRQEAGSFFSHLRQKKESQEICFLGEKSYQKFLHERYREEDFIRKGDVLNTDGAVIGTHKGYIFYTIGQRRGLGISHNRPLYIKEIKPEKNVIVAGEESEIYSDHFYLKDINFISGKACDSLFKTSIKIRYNSPEFPATVQVLEGNRAFVKADQPQKAITPGQSAVFYDGDTLIGGGIIL